MNLNKTTLRMMGFLLLFLSPFTDNLFAQGVTTSSLSGIVSDNQKQSLIGATVVVTHVPSGTEYGTTTDVDGNYRIPGMRVGGPYRIVVSYTGYSDYVLENVYLRLGENQKFDFSMEETAIELTTIQVVAKAGTAGQTAGSSTQITDEQIEAMPTLNRSINDYLKLTPQSKLTTSDGISFAGVNNRLNAIYIDGAVNNDVFGLANSGTNGGQTGIAPFSIDIIDQFQVALSPYDVTLGGFAGAGINAVTKSGTNQFQGTAYYFMQNENLAGKTNGVLAERLNIDPTKLAPFDQRLYGASLSGPIAKNKAFFFINAEIQNDETPVPYEVASYIGNSKPADLDQLRNYLIETYDYDPGSYGSTSDELKGLKLFGKVNINLSQNHKLTLRHQYTKAEQYDRNGGFTNTINFSNNGVYFPSTTNSSAIELNSRFSNKFANNLILGYTKVVDDRDPIGNDLPYVYINDGSGTIRFGSEEFSTGNRLEQSIISLTNNFKWYAGNHTFTFGTHNEFYDIYNIFIGQNYGTYRFANLQDFLNNGNAIEYDRSYSLVDDITGDGSAAAADFKAVQFGIYAQDEWAINQNFTLTGGLRLDIPVITSDPEVDTYFNETALPKMQEAYAIAKDVEAGKAPDGQLMISPRLGFNYDVAGNGKTIIRGGAGIFTSRIPFVWPGAMFNNNGLTLGRVDETNLAGTPIQFNPNIQTQPVHPNFSIPSGQIDIFVKDFKYPQVFRGNLSIDQQLPGGIEATFEGIYTKTLNNILYTNVNNDPAVRFNWTGTPDDRPVFNRRSLDSKYSAVYVGSNTDEGYTYTLTANFAKRFPFGLNATLGYVYGDAHAINEGTSSQNSSQWRGQVHVDGRNSPLLGRSDFAIGHRLVSSLSYKLKWNKAENAATTFSVFFNGQSGTAFSYVIGGNNGRNVNNETGSTSANRTLVYIPETSSDIVLIDYTSGGKTVTAAEQWELLNAFIEDDPYLSQNRGNYAEKNSNFAPFTSLFDLAIRQDFGIKTGGVTNKLQVSLDILNFANLLNSDWGVNYIVPGSEFNNFSLYQFESYAADGTTPRFTYRSNTVGNDKWNISNTGSRWRMRLGFRYIFN